jgi:hypothetical protein
VAFRDVLVLARLSESVVQNNPLTITVKYLPSVFGRTVGLLVGDVFKRATRVQHIRIPSHIE